MVNENVWSPDGADCEAADGEFHLHHQSDRDDDEPSPMNVAAAAVLLCPWLDA
jgi:hypothetical protein